MKNMNDNIMACDIDTIQRIWINTTFVSPNTNGNIPKQNNCVTVLIIPSVKYSFCLCKIIGILEMGDIRKFNINQIAIISE